MLWPRLHQYQTPNTHDSSAKPAGSTSIEMRLAWIYIVSTLLIIASCEKEESKSASSKNEDEDPKEKDLQRETLENIDKFLNTVTDPEGKLPILPPIILLDFTNGTNSTSDEKSKRTVNGNLGYGYNTNNLFSGKYNYYFPAGKSGTTVSIEESITPFQPKTIVESVNLINGKIYDNGAANGYSGSLRYTGYSTTPAPIVEQLFLQRQQQQLQHQRLLQQQQFISNLQYPIVKPVYGQRTKLQKAPAGNFRSAQTFSTTPNPSYASYSTPRPGFDSYTTTTPGFSAYTTPKPSYTAYTTPQPSFHLNSHTSGLNLAGYTTPRPPSYQGFSSPRLSAYVNPTMAPYNVQGLGYSTSRPSYESVSTVRPTYETVSTPRPVGLNSANPAGLNLVTALTGYPKYTIENGVKYEHKIIWKYPNGKVSENPPASYGNDYFSFGNANKSPLNVAYDNTKPVSGYQNVQGATYAEDSIANIYSQSPAQFPTDQNLNYPKQTQFVSSASLSSTDFGSVPQQQAHKLSYQNQVPKTNGRDGSAQNVFSSSSEVRTSTYDRSKQAFEPEYKEDKVITTYSVNSPNPEYTYTTESSLKGADTTKSSNLYTPSGEISPNILSKYTPQVQRYLTKVLKNGVSSQNNNYDNSNSQTYSNRQYSNLLNYNPSISQYIRNPSSILNAHPTFIQAGNSLIPVIILRVDGSAPIEPKVTPNINLKALLRQYLTQYANSVNDLNQNRNYGDNIQSYEKSEAAGQRPLYDLAHLTESLSQYSEDPTFARTFSQKFAKNIAENPQNFNTRTNLTPSNYDSLIKSGSNRNTGFTSTQDSQISKPQKVKSVQIIEDPRFTSYTTHS
ncbi:uncharacterized protein LOC107266805 [Cephus cinctus]|uniref:Uncharacterized protein LOC107266805 n=1 Tax=Cephus cinctus TaxID=211228 RepID=A0AAJ7BSE1_CEPCN|nr:uncharacterized protein LOC107266805 [Cephus cinctus]